jgi:hypothetical protein
MSEPKLETLVAATPAATSDPVVELLKGYGVSDDVIGKIVSDLGASSVEDLNGLTEADLTGAGMKVLPARKLVEKLRPVAPATAAAEAPASAPTAGAMTARLDLLPKVPDDESWLKALKVGGVLKFSPVTVSGTVSAALANRVGLYDLPKRLVQAMEQQAESLAEPVGVDFFEMQRMLTEHSYAEIFAAIPGATGRYATQARKDALLSKLDQNLWSALTSFHGQLNNWMDTWQKSGMNPSMMMGAVAALVNRTSAPPMMMAPPTDALRDGAEAVIEVINKVFAGTGILVATALAYDAQQIRKALETPTLPAQVGAVNREQMLKQLGVAVTSDYPRLEQSVKQYVLAIIELSNVTAGQAEIDYLTALWQLGSAITWDKLGLDSSGRAGRVTGIGGRGARSPGDRSSDL